MRWDLAQAPVPTADRSSGTSVKAAREALSYDDALRTIAGTDPRPLLVLRECARCNKTDDALLQPGVDNEKVLFLARWFHCVRLPVDVVAPDHPFHALFPSDESEHLFVATLDGKRKHPLESDTSRAKLCTAMRDVLSATYAKDPEPLFQDLAVYGDQLDVLDNEVKDLTAQRAKLMEARVPDAKKLAKVDAELARAKKQIADKLAAIKKAHAIPLKPAPKTAKPG